MRQLDARGRELNQGNPWLGSSSRRDKLRASLGLWKAIGTDDKVLSWIGYGKKLLFHERPENLAFDNAKLAFQHRDFVLKEVDTALKDGGARSVHYSFAKIINPILIDRKKKNNKLRMCLDLRFCNSQTAHARFKLATLLTVLPHELRQGDIIFTEDLEGKAMHAKMHNAWKPMHEWRMVGACGMRAA